MAKCGDSESGLWAVTKRLGTRVGSPLSRLAPETIERLMPVANKLLSPRLGEAIASSIGRFATPALLDRLADFNAQSSACCPEDSVNLRFVRRYLNLSKTNRSRGFIASYLATLSRKRANELVAGYARIALAGTLRHQILNRKKDETATPATVLNEVQLALYSGCNLDCVGCYSREQRAELKGSASPEMIEYLVDQSAANGAFAIHVVGHGEPFLSLSQANQLLDIISARPHLFFTVVTNGVLMPDSLARRIGTSSNLLVFVSVDGPQKLHDERRGEGSFAKAVAALSALKSHSAPCGFSTTVTRRNLHAVTTDGFAKTMRDAGCAIGGYSRYFPLSPESAQDLLLTREDVRSHAAAFESLRERCDFPLMDLDDLEANSGCRSRAGLTVYIDGITGQVSPCIRSPFSPADCHIDRGNGVGLGEVLALPFFTHYRRDQAACQTWCGEDPVREFSAVEEELRLFGYDSAAAANYRSRWQGQQANAALAASDGDVSEAKETLVL